MLTFFVVKPEFRLEQRGKNVVEWYSGASVQRLTTKETGSRNQARIHAILSFSTEPKSHKSRQQNASQTLNALSSCILGSSRSPSSHAHQYRVVRLNRLARYQTKMRSSAHGTRPWQPPSLGGDFIGSQHTGTTLTLTLGTGYSSKHNFESTTRFISHPPTTTDTLSHKAACRLVSTTGGSEWNKKKRKGFLLFLTAADCDVSILTFLD